MSEYTRLIELPPEAPEPKRQCEAGISDNLMSPLRRSEQTYNRRRAAYRDFEPYCCQKQATVEIDGHGFCNGHAGQIALAQMLGEQHRVKIGPGTQREQKERRKW